MADNGTRVTELLQGLARLAGATDSEIDQCRFATTCASQQWIRELWSDDGRTDPNNYGQAAYIAALSLAFVRKDPRALRNAFIKLLKAAVDPTVSPTEQQEAKDYLVSMVGRLEED